MRLQDVKDYLNKRLEKVQHSNYHDCCKRHLFDELLDMQNFYEEQVDEEIASLTEKDEVKV